MSKYKAISTISIIYLGLVSLFLVKHGSWFSPDQFFAAALLGVLILGKFKQFVRDWSFPTVLFLSYEYLRGLVPHLTARAEVNMMIDFDQTVFGILPTLKLQQIFFSGSAIHWYDTLAVFIYMSHFIVPMLVSFVFWLYKKEFFTDYFVALLVLSYMAFLTYIVFPAMPPWMASDKGYILPVNHIMDQVWTTFSTTLSLPSVYKFFGANTVAAVPSLHAAYPFLTLLFVIKRFRKWGFLVVPYVLAVWLSIVYLGEHYVFDIVVGVIYAIVAFIVVEKRKDLLKKVTSIRLNFLVGK